MYKADELPLKTYGKWAGNEHGWPYDPKRCAYPVWGQITSHQCNNKASVGIFCKMHEPVAWQKRRDARDAKWEAKWKEMAERDAASAKRKKSTEAFRAALEEIAKGTLNDPTGYATMILEEWK